MSALLALSATHLAWLTDCPLTANMAYEHRGVALKGLHEAIGEFSPENSDAVLAASLLLSWQATEWYGSPFKIINHADHLQARLDPTDAWHFFCKSQSTYATATVTNNSPGHRCHAAVEGRVSVR